MELALIIVVHFLIAVLAITYVLAIEEFEREEVRRQKLKQTDLAAYYEDLLRGLDPNFPIFKSETR